MTARTCDTAEPRAARNGRLRVLALVAGSVSVGVVVALATTPLRHIDVAVVLDHLDASSTARLVRGALAMVDQVLTRF